MSRKNGTVYEWSTVEIVDLLKLAEEDGLSGGRLGRRAHGDLLLELFQPLVVGALLLDVLLEQALELEQRLGNHAHVEG